jgi:hypothetical protein
MTDRNPVRKTGLWPFTLIFGVVTALCLILVVLYALGGKRDEAFTAALIGIVPLSLTVCCALMDRRPTARRVDASPYEPQPERSLKWATRLSEELEAQSGLDPENSDRAKAAMTQGPPPIG